MKKIKGYIISAFYNIKSNKAHSIFCICGITLTFVFIVIVLQLLETITGNTPPFINAERTIVISDFRDDKGYAVKGLNASEINLFLENLKDYEYCSLSDFQTGNIFINNYMNPVGVSFVNGDFWKINQFHFLAGRAFLPKEVNQKAQLAVIREDIAKFYFRGDALGKTIEFQDITYKIIGVVSNYSAFGAFERGSIWLPYVFDKFVPSGIEQFILQILPQKETKLINIKQQIARLLKLHFENKNINIAVYPEGIYTLKELKILLYGNNLLSYGIPSILFLLLFIPALNIITLSIANTNNRAQEISIRKAMGATVFSSFIQMMTENLLLVITGTILSILLTKPVANIIAEYFFSNKLTGNTTIISSIDLFVLVFEIFPLSLLFSLLSGGIPAYLIAKKNISEIMKGGL
jgi:ABC-type antimicrobial peptide transport system permease subunit